MSASFRPAWWLPGAHLQTFWPYMFRRNHKLETRRERFDLPDGDFVDLNWTVRPTTGPIVIILHGLEGSIQSSYAGGILKAIEARGWRGLFMHFRSCSGESNRHARFYHSGDTHDFAAVVEMIRQREPETLLAAVGYSLGGNVLLKWLGETGADCPLVAAAAVSVPFELKFAAERINRGFSRLYQWHFLRSLRQKVYSKIDELPVEVSVSELKKIRSMRIFDDLITAPLHGFEDVDDYYKKASSRPWLRNIARPTLLLQSKDDPFMTPNVVPEPYELSPSITLELTPRGGHVGFVEGVVPLRPKYWLDQRVPDFLATCFAKNDELKKLHI